MILDDLYHRFPVTKITLIGLLNDPEPLFLQKYNFLVFVSVYKLTFT